jgi:N-acetylglucosamine-6-sulfatase
MNTKFTISSPHPPPHHHTHNTHKFRIELYLNLFLIFLCGIGFIGCDTSTNNNSSEDPTVPIERPDSWWIERHTNRINNVINNQKIILIGDSITQGWEATEAWDLLNIKYNNKITNLGFDGDRTQHVIWRLTNGEFTDGINPEYVVLMIGTNNSSDGDRPESIAVGIDEIIKVINRVSPSTKIILLSIFPRGTDNNNIYRIINSSVNDIIETYNGHLNVIYYDIGQYYMDQNGILINELYSSDLLHLSSSGYILWKNKIIELIGN